MAKLPVNIQKNNVDMLIEAFKDKENSNKYGEYLTVNIQHATWTWENSAPIPFYGGYVYRYDDYKVQDTLFECSSIESEKGGVTSTFSDSFQLFNYNRDMDQLEIKGNKSGRDYTVVIQF